METAIIQHGSQQDYAVSGYVGDMQYIAVMDGHGTNECINFMRELDFDEVASAPNPAEALWDKVENGGTFIRSGSTLTFARVYENIIDVWNVGDSTTVVFINDELVYTTTKHNFSNPDEIKRVRDQKLVSFIRPGKSPFPVSETTIENIESPVGVFPNHEHLVPSQSYGHGGLTGFAPSRKQLVFHPTDKVRIVCGSDGLFDMLVDVKTGSAQNLVQEASRRWRKTDWVFLDGKTQIRTKYCDEDDISCAIWENKIVHRPSLYTPHKDTFEGVRQIEELGKARILHFNPGELSDTLREVYSNPTLRNDLGIKMYGNVKPVGWEYKRWDGKGDYYLFAEDQIEDKVWAKMKPLF
jgi:serine/threonine protein phosphatase PrpC